MTDAVLARGYAYGFHASTTTRHEEARSSSFLFLASSTLME
jgi:hypothetical protein